jgi:hypothetical protein
MNRRLSPAASNTSFSTALSLSSLGQALDDGRLPYPGVADEDGVVLRPAREDLHEPADLLVAADDRIELSGPRPGGEVDGVALEGLVAALGVGVRHALGPANGLEGVEHLLAGEARAPEDGGERRVLPADPGEDEVLPARVIVREGLGLGDGVLHVAPGLGQKVGLDPAAGDAGKFLEGGFEIPEKVLTAGGGLLNERGDHPVLLLQEGEKEMGGHDALLAPLLGLGLGRLEGLLRPVGEFFDSHGRFLSFRQNSSLSHEKRLIRDPYTRWSTSNNGGAGGLKVPRSQILFSFSRSSFFIG